MQLVFVLSLVFAIIIAVFALNNGEKVTIDFLFSTKEVSQALVILVSTAFGAVIVAVLGLVAQIKLSLKVKEQGKQIKTLQEEKDELLMQLETNSIKEFDEADKVPLLQDNEEQNLDEQEKINEQSKENKLEDNQEVDEKDKTDNDFEKELEKELEREKQEGH